MESVLNLLSVFILLSSFVLIAGKRIKSYINAFRLQSLLVACATAVLGIQGITECEGIDLLVIFLVVLVLKVIYIPRLLEKTYASVEYSTDKDFYPNIPIQILICCTLVVFANFALSSTQIFASSGVSLYMVEMLSVVLMGLFFMITRKKAIGQIVGFLTIENGLFSIALFLSRGMPVIIDMGIFVDLITGVLIMGILVFKINEKFDSINTNKLNKLRG